MVMAFYILQTVQYHNAGSSPRFNPYSVHNLIHQSYLLIIKLLQLGMKLHSEQITDKVHLGIVSYESFLFVND